MSRRKGFEMETIKKVFPRTVPVMAGYVFLGIAYGISMKAAGLPTWTVIACCIFIYSGTMQFAMISILPGAFAPLTTAVMAILIGARHLFYGLTMFAKYGSLSHPSREYCIYAMTDETYSLVLEDPEEGEKPEKWYTSISALDQTYWTLGSVIGAIAGQIIPFDLTGLEFAMTALFTVVVTEQTRDAYKTWKEGRINTRHFVMPLILGFGATALSLAVLGTGSFLLAAMMVILIGFYISYRRELAETAAEEGGAR